MLQHISSVKQLSNKKLLDGLFERATHFQAVQPKNYPKPLENKIIASLFFEPSTRTRFSFETAVYRLGGNVITVENGIVSSSAVKGETIEDTIRTINGYADGIIMRHPVNGAALVAARFSNVPFINAGEGSGEHPTQALLDLYTIQKTKGNLDGLKIALVGDLLYGRTVHSLIYLLSIYKVELYLIAPPALKVPAVYKNHLKQKGVKFHEASSWKDIIGNVDVMYMTRVQKERFDSPKQYNLYKDSFVFDNSSLKQLKNDAAILHPLPRVNEIASEVDNDPRALYFEQVKNGLYVRMALLEYVFGDNKSNA